MLEKIKKHSPKEVYVGAAFLFILLFLNSTEVIFQLRLSDIFDITGSIVYGLIRGIGDNNINSDEAIVFYWVITFVYVGLISLKVRKISKWLWDN